MKPPLDEDEVVVSGLRQELGAAVAVVSAVSATISSSLTAKLTLLCLPSIELEGLATL